MWEYGYAKTPPVLTPDECADLAALYGYEGRDFLLVEQRPRAQSRGESIATKQGEIVIFTTRHRPVEGTRGVYRAAMRHGVSRVTKGLRYTLGVIFHDAK